MAVRRSGGDVAPAVAANIKRQAFQDLMRFSGMLQGVMLLADDLGEIASLDEAKTTLNDQIGKLQKAKDDLTSSNEGLGAEIARLKAQSASDREKAAGELAEAKRSADDTLGRAKKCAEHIVATARADAQAIRAKLDSDSAAALANAQNRGAAIIADTNASLAGVRAEIVKKQQEIESVGAQVLERHAALADIKRQIQALLGNA